MVGEEPASRSVVGQRCEPDGCRGTVFDCRWCPWPAEFGTDPPWGAGIDQNASAREVGGQNASEGVECGLRDAVRGLASASHGGECSQTAADVDDPAVLLADHEWDDGSSALPRPQQIDL